MNLQASALRQRVAERGARQGLLRPRTIAVASGKAGVGKTTLVANLALALRWRGLRVVVVDAAPGRANVSSLLGLQPRWTLQQVLWGGVAVRDIALESPGGVRVVPAAPGIEELGNLTPWEQRRLGCGFGELDAERDLVLVDGAAGAAGLSAATDEVIAVTTPDPGAITDAYALLKVLASRRADPAIHLAVNRVGLRQEARQVADCIVRTARRHLGLAVHPIGFVPEDPEVVQAALEHALFVAAYPECPAARCVGAIAARLHGQAQGAARTSLAECVRRLSAFAAEGLDGWPGGQGEAIC